MGPRDQYTVLDTGSVQLFPNIESSFQSLLGVSYFWTMSVIRLHPYPLCFIHRGLDVEI